MGYGDYWVKVRNAATPQDLQGLLAYYSEKPFSLPRASTWNRTCVTGLDITTYSLGGAWTYLTNVNIAYNEGIRCGAFDLGISASMASLAVGLAAIGLM